MAQMPPLPPQAYGDGDSLTHSELMPFRSKKISIWKSRALVPLAATAGTCVLLFSIMGSVKGASDVLNYMRVLACFLVFAMFAGIYFYVGERKNMLWYLIPVAITWAQMIFLLGPYIYVFRTILPGGLKQEGFGSAFVANFFGAGLMEELMKAIPALLGLLLALRLRASGKSGGKIGRGLALGGPVDGLLVGVAAGAAFILFETLLQYVPNQINQVLQNTKGDLGIALLSGFLLLMPRVLNGIIGHMAWAGISGYFIGLAVSHPRAAWKLLLVGWALPASLHGFWNASAGSDLFGGYGLWVSAALSLFLFVSCVLKAKQLEVSRLGGAIDGHSILAPSPPATTPTAPSGIVPPPATGIAGAFTGAATAVERLVGFTAKTTVPNPGAAPPVLPANGLSIGTQTTRYALSPNPAIDLSALFADAGVPAGFLGSVGGRPDGAFDVRNTGSSAWLVAMPDGATMSVGPGSGFVAAPGARLILGPVSIDIQAF